MLDHDKKNINLFLNWLTATLILIFLMIIVGGLTRLTNSGLSITEWQLFSGILPPFKEETWIKYFELYKQIPQYKIINPLMNLQEFKVIFYWEYGHRMLGRIIGLFFLIPLLYFYLVKKINIKTLIPFIVILFLIILQGVIGWYMVSSGLVNNVTVSHYRLSLHLVLAILILSMIFWQILNLKNKNSKNFFNLSKNNFPFFFLVILIFTQLILGAFVSGLDAGKIYQTWPLMGNNFFPDDININNSFNFLDFENHSLVQFYHRNLAYFITFYILVLSFHIFKNEDRKAYRPILILLLVLFAQVILGIFTLLTNLHIFLASLHQIFSVILVLSSINLYFFMIK